MRRRAIATLLLCYLGLPATAQAWATRDLCLIDTPRIHAEVLTPDLMKDIRAIAETIPNGTGRYWRITSPSGAASHLWGTMHLNIPAILRLPEAVEQDIAAARVIATEVDFNALSRAELESRYNYQTYYHEEARVTDWDLPLSMINAVGERLSALGWGGQAVFTLKPAAIAELLLSPPCNDFNAGIYPIQDHRISLLGALAGAATIGLEAPGAFFDRLDSSDEAALTTALIAVSAVYLAPDFTRDAYSTSLALYLQGRIADMMAWERIHFDDTYPDGLGLGWLDTSDAYILSDRNRGFLDTARSELAKGGVFIAVGAYHLPGDTGLIELLRRDGFTVTRVALPDEATP
ncbi:TraB family protein [Roseovarius sp. THAF9]|uniref:TraB/GumN family protein n=1 Tax=Roseovarius sp. THAF9 TaxID=2587847 RepID=UPI0012690D53|nr:TraB/GumN family protein [Roseovarius sp. THAF9]QFT91691.1 TraB family protein [Roseovarius sp. THAF9]